MMSENYLTFGQSKLTLETGKMAGQAQGAVYATLGETAVLATVVISDEPKEGVDFFPMLVDYEERLYAAGKISGSRWIKREGRPSEEAVLASRLIDRPIRPLFPKNYRHDVQIIVTVLSYDGKNDPDVLATIAVSAALMQAGAPFKGPIATARVASVKEKFILNPAPEEVAQSDLDIYVAATKEKIMMLEAKGCEVNEDKIIEAIEFAQQKLKPVIEFQEKLFPQKVAEPEANNNEAIKSVEKLIGKKLKQAVSEIDKEKRELAISEFEQEVLKNLEGDYKQADIKSAFQYLLEKEVREAIITKNQRPDGRGLEELRPLSAEVGLLPRTHGSAMFTRGQTQVLSIVTLGSPGEEQFIETMETEGKKRFMHHYNFPPFCTGEIRPLRSVSRREIGHGALAEKAILPLIPNKEEFPYTIRVVSEVLSSNGSTSMASVCAASMALMDAGVPLKKHIAGVSIGLVTKGKEYKLLTDIQGIEDFTGDMDFKVAGTKEGVTAIQLDTKISGIETKILKEALSWAKKARLQILAKMEEAIAKPRETLSPYAPRIEAINISPDKIREVIGPGGKTINKIIEETGVEIDIEQDGHITVTSDSPENMHKAMDKIKALTREAKPGELYQGRVTRILDFGAFVELWPGQEGMIHISELAPFRVRKVSDIVKVGQMVTVKVISIDEQGRVNLSLKQVPHQQ